jgi:ATP-dependent helicase HrpB
VLAERPYALAGAPATDSDVLSRADRLESAPFAVRQAARQIEALARQVLGPPTRVVDDLAMRRALLAGYPDRLARRRAAGSDRLLLASGHGAVLGRESGVRMGDLLLAIEVTAGPGGPGSEALVRMASRVERDWLVPVEREVVHRFDAETGSVRAFERSVWGGLVISDRVVAPDPAAAAEILLGEMRRRGPDAETQALLRRARFAALELDADTLMRRAVEGRSRLADVDVPANVPGSVRAALDRLAPERLAVPSGRSVALDYREDGAVVASVKLQELFGMGESPRFGPRQQAVTIELLAPNGRPVQTTRDLRGFWDRTYPEVKKELRGRYPKHPWPDDPWTARPTHRTKARRDAPRR